MVDVSERSSKYPESEPKMSVHMYYCMTGRAIWRNIQLEGGSIGPSAARDNKNQRAEYFPISPDPWSAIIDLLYDFVQIRKVAEP